MKISKVQFSLLCVLLYVAIYSMEEIQKIMYKNNHAIYHYLGLILWSPQSLHLHWTDDEF